MRYVKRELYNFNNEIKGFLKNPRKNLRYKMFESIDSMMIDKNMSSIQYMNVSLRIEVKWNIRDKGK